MSGIDDMQRTIRISLHPDEKKIDEKEEKIVALDESDIQILKTYVRYRSTSLTPGPRTLLAFPQEDRE